MFLFDFDGKQFSHVGVYLQWLVLYMPAPAKGVMVARLPAR